MAEKINPFQSPQDASPPVFTREERPVAIYAAQNLQQAHLLRQTLAEQGICAEVTNQLLEGGSGVDIVGWPTLPRVLVAERDAQRARQLAVELDDRMAEMAKERSMTDREEEPRATGVVAEWPRCPECGQRRITRCPVCGTAGQQFPSAEDEPPAVDVFNPAAASSGMSCGSAGCRPNGCVPQDDAEQGADESAESSASPRGGMLICPTCDEAFRPVYARRCEWCGHEFADGYATDTVLTPGEPMSWRIVAVIVGLLALAGAAAAYFAMLV